MLLPSLALGICVMPTWITCLHASLSSELRSLRQAAISSALGMNELQSLNTSDVHAWRCSAVPCEDERAGQAVASSKHRDMHDRTKDLDRRGVHLFWPVVFIPKSRVVNRSRYWTSSRRHRYALAGARACRETSALVAFDPAAAPSPPGMGLRRIERYGGCSAQPVCINVGTHEPPSHHTFVQALMSYQR